jgi:hypothetical protein
MEDAVGIIGDMMMELATMENALQVLKKTLATFATQANGKKVILKNGQ